MNNNVTSMLYIFALKRRVIVDFLVISYVKLYISLCTVTQVVEHTLGMEQMRPLPECPILMPVIPQPLNVSNKK